MISTKLDARLTLNGAFFLLARGLSIVFDAWSHYFKSQKSFHLDTSADVPFLLRSVWIYYLSHWAAYALQNISQSFYMTCRSFPLLESWISQSCWSVVRPTPREWNLWFSPRGIISAALLPSRSNLQGHASTCHYCSYKMESWSPPLWELDRLCYLRPFVARADCLYYEGSWSLSLRRIFAPLARCDLWLLQQSGIMGATYSTWDPCCYCCMESWLPH